MGESLPCFKTPVPIALHSKRDAIPSKNMTIIEYIIHCKKNCSWITTTGANLQRLPVNHCPDMLPQQANGQSLV